MITLEGIEKKYDLGQVTITALDSVSLTIEAVSYTHLRAHET